MEGTRLVATFAFNPQTDNDLSFAVGDIVVVTNKETGDEGWWEGYLASDADKHVGYFPSNYALPAVGGDEVDGGAGADGADADAGADGGGDDANDDDILAAALDALDGGDTGSVLQQQEQQGRAVPAERKPLTTPMPMADETASLEELNQLVAEATASPPVDADSVLRSPVTATAPPVRPSRRPPPREMDDVESDGGASSDGSDGDDGGAGAASAVASGPAAVEAVVSAEYVWEAAEEAYEVLVDVESERGSKFGGLKKFTSYKITTPSKGWEVAHRYKHFHWLRERLVAKYAGVAVPEIPSKQLTGRFKDNLVSYRRHFLAVFLNRVARHPLLRTAPVFLHFLSVDSSSEGRVWKEGKRAAEKDKAQGKEFFTVVASPRPNLSTGSEVDQALDFARAMPQHAKHWSSLVDVMNASSKKRMELVSATEELWQGFSQMSGSTGDAFCWRESCPACFSATSCLATVSDTLRSIATIEHEASLAESDLANAFQSARDALGVTLSAIKSEVALRTAVVAKTAKAQAANQVGVDLAGAEKHLSVVMAELNHFHNVRAVDNKVALLAYARTQADLLRRGAEAWANLVAVLEEYPVENEADVAAGQRLLQRL